MFLLQSSGGIHHRQGSRNIATVHVPSQDAHSHGSPAIHGISTSSSANPICGRADRLVPTTTVGPASQGSDESVPDAVTLAIPHSRSFDHFENKLHDEQGSDERPRRLADGTSTLLADSFEPLATEQGPVDLRLPSSTLDLPSPKSMDFPTGAPHAYTEPISFAHTLRQRAPSFSSSSSSNSSNSGSKLPLYRWAQVPEYLQFNPYILSHYRSGYSFRQAWLSLTAVHNETGNIWTHLAPIPVFLYLTTLALFSTAPSWAQSSWAWADRLVLALYLASAIKCFACSSMFHACYCINHAVYMQFGCLDYQGISVLISGGAVALTYAAMYSSANAWIKAVAITGAASISLVGVIGPRFPLWHTAVFRARRTAIYVTAGLLGTVMPIVWLVFVDGGVPVYANLWWGTHGWKVVVGSLVFGVAVYVGKLPERWWPGAFDLVGHSHQWWHVAVVAAVVAHGLFVGQMVQWRVMEGELR